MPDSISLPSWRQLDSALLIIRHWWFPPVSSSLLIQTMSACEYVAEATVVATPQTRLSHTGVTLVLPTCSIFVASAPQADRIWNLHDCPLIPRSLLWQEWHFGSMQASGSQLDGEWLDTWASSRPITSIRWIGWDRTGSGRRHHGFSFSYHRHSLSQ